MIKFILCVALFLLVATSLWFRVDSLENLPGINGDEAWYGVQAFQIATGRPFALRTPTGLLLNPFFTGIEVPLICGFRPSFWILRVPAVFSSILALALVYGMGKRVLDRTTAVAAAMLLAVLPAAIAYSRFGWDASQTPLFSFLALYFAIRGKSLMMLICFVTCIIVHVYNIFLFPVLLPSFLVTVWSGEQVPARRRAILGLTAVLGIIALLVLLLIDSRYDRFLLASRALPHNWLRFLGHYGRLISGITVYEFVAGPLSPRTRDLYDAAFWGLFVTFLLFGGRSLIRDRRWDRLALVAGLILGALGLYLVRGPDVIRPGYERYGMFLIVPTTLVIACLVASVLPIPEDDRLPIARQRCFAFLLVLGWIMLYSFKVHYFDPLRATGGASHVTFRTARIEPKQQAIDLILRDVALSKQAAASAPEHPQPPGHSKAPIGGGVLSVQPILAESWWLYWPLRFLACRNPDVDVIPFEGDASFGVLADRAEKVRGTTTLSSGGYAVAFAGSDFERLVASTITPDRLERWDVLDYGGRKLITVLRVKSNR
jgi:4-amino-4-deoxy-L-arabinose transferase-like glycosyltransferase